MKDICITTVDNPFNPITNFEDWYAYDRLKGYYTCERLASIAKCSDDLSDETNEEILKEAYKELIKTGAIAKDGSIVEYIVVERQRQSN